MKSESKNCDRIVVEGKHEKLNCTPKANAKGKTEGQNAREATFPLSTSTEKGEGREIQVSQQCGRPWHSLRSPAEPPQINIQSRRDRFASQQDFKAVHPSRRENRKDLRGRRTGRRGTHALGQI